MTNIPEDLEQIIKDIVAYEESLKRGQEGTIEETGEYLYDYSEYPEYKEDKSEPARSTIIKIDL